MWEMEKRKFIVPVFVLILCVAGTVTMYAGNRTGSNAADGKVPAKNVRLQSKQTKTKIKLNKKKATIYVGKKLKLKVQGVKAKKVQWYTSNKKIATVKKGTVKAKKKGSVTITAKVNGKKYKCKITVKKLKKPAVINKTTQMQALFDRLDEGENMLVSPLSLKYALSMAANGANNTARQGIESFLKTKTDTANSDLKKAMDMAEKDSMINISNSFWYRDTYTINSDYEKLLKKYYYADINKELFNSDTVHKINQWVYDKTDGMIDKIIDDVNEGDIAILINAILFEGKWTVPFKHEDTYKGNFTKADGKKVQTEMMKGSVWNYYENDKATGFEKTYGKNGEYSFIAILPKTKGNFKISDLKMDEFLVSGTNAYEVYIHLPKFEYRWESSLIKPLKQTSVKHIFNSAINPLNKMFLPTGQSIYVSDIMQSCKVIMEEDGTKAAAVTATVVKATSVPNKNYKTKTVKLNRPFAYIIKNNQTDEIMFMGKVIDPTQK